jgi:enoyl-[acyl-carrier-protein] reductase (NADH)
VASTDEISDAVLYLASDGAKAITGAEFQIDMGHSKV